MHTTSPTRAHRRQCGKIFCADCTENTRPVKGYDEPVRVCKSCDILLAHSALPSGARKAKPESKSSWFSRREKSTAGTDEVDARKHISLRPSRTSQQIGSGDADADAAQAATAAAPEDEGDRFTYACVIATFLSNDFFESDTDPGNFWRDAELARVVTALDQDKRKGVVEACMTGRDVNPIPLIAFLCKSDGGAAGVIGCYLRVTALGGVYDARARAVVAHLACVVGISRHQLAVIEGLWCNLPCHPACFSCSMTY